MNKFKWSCRFMRPSSAKMVAARMSDGKALVRRGMKHFFRRHQAWRQAFGMMVPQESLQHLAVGRKAVGPEVVPHQFARSLELFIDKRQRAFARRNDFNLVQA